MRFTINAVICGLMLRLTIIKIIHTIIWICFNMVIFYMLYAVIADKIDALLWLGYALIMLEVITLFIFRFSCPLTILARKYSDSAKANFDIYLPEWLARHNKQVYTGIMIVILVLTIYRLIT